MAFSIFKRNALHSARKYEKRIENAIKIHGEISSSFSIYTKLYCLKRLRNKPWCRILYYRSITPYAGSKQNGTQSLYRALVIHIKDNKSPIPPSCTSIQCVCYMCLFITSDFIPLSVRIAHTQTWISIPFA